MQVRYRYRLYPAPGQQQIRARTFGCARVVYNDCLRVRDEAHAAGEKIDDTEGQRRVVTLAKPTPERAWPGEVASVALVQACQDARRAYRNWFDSLSGSPATDSRSTESGCTSPRPGTSRSSGPGRCHPSRHRSR